MTIAVALFMAYVLIAPLAVHAQDGDQTPTVAKATFGKVSKVQEAACKPVQGRYVLLRALSEVNDGPWATIAELGVVGE